MHADVFAVPTARGSSRRCAGRDVERRRIVRGSRRNWPFVGMVRRWFALPLGDATVRIPPERVAPRVPAFGCGPHARLIDLDAQTRSIRTSEIIEQIAILVVMHREALLLDERVV